MADTVNIPKIGPVKKLYVYGVGGTAAAYVAWRYWQAGNAATAAPEEIPADVDTSSVTSGGGGSYGPGNVQYAGTVTQDDEDLITTNDQWARAAVDNVSGFAGFDAQVASVGIGKYLARQKLAAGAEINAVRTAVALTGPPPVGGPYSIIEDLTATPESPHGVAPNTPGGLSLNTAHGDNAILQWQTVPGATKYQLDTASSVMNLGQTGSARKTGLKPNTRYSARVRAGNATGWSPWSPYIYYRTLPKGK